MKRLFWIPLALSLSTLAACDDVGLVGFRTTETAIKATRVTAPVASLGSVGYLGVSTIPASVGLTVVEVASGSPAERAGILIGDVILSLNKKSVKTAVEFRELIQSETAGAEVEVGYIRGKTRGTMTVKLSALSKPKSINDERAVLGIQLGEPTAEGTLIRRVGANTPAARAGVRAGDLLTKLEGRLVADPDQLDTLLNEKKAGDSVLLSYSRSGAETQVSITLAEPPPVAGDNQTFVARNVWKKPTYRLAIIAIEYPDVKHNEKASSKSWSDALFSNGIYNGESATGQKVHGSMNDFYREVSSGAFGIEGKVFDWIQVEKNRADYSEGNGTGPRSRGALFSEAMTKITERDGKEALDNFDGVVFIYAGGRFQTSRGGLYWPHRSTYRFGNKNWPYFIIPEGGQRMTDISVMCHEFGHMLGMPDLYARPENPGSEGLGTWCLMSNQTGAGRPQHMGAWCKMQLGWLTPTEIDPAVPQKLILSPVNGSKTECFKIPLRADGSEYLLLENRRKIGFDASLPSEGLLIWRVLGNRPVLEESHGVDGPAGPRAFMDSVPFPSVSNNSFTTLTTPSSRSKLGGGLSVSITNIRQLPDGRVTFYVGYVFD